MTDRFTLSRIPNYCQSPTTSPPEHKALLIGINYASSVNDNDYRELKGPVNDANEMKKALIGAISAPALLFLGSRRLTHWQSSLTTRKRTFA